MQEIYVLRDTFADEDDFSKVFKAARFLEFVVSNTRQPSDEIINIAFKHDINTTLIDLINKSVPVRIEHNWFLWFYAFTLLFRSWQRKIRTDKSDAWKEVFETRREKELLFENVLLKAKLCCFSDDSIKNALNYSYAFHVKSVTRRSIKIEPFGRAEVKDNIVYFTIQTGIEGMDRTPVECPYSETITGFNPWK